MNWVTGVDIALAGGDLKTEPFQTMDTWYTKNAKAIASASALSGSKSTAEALQVGPFAIVVTAKTVKNAKVTSSSSYVPPGAVGWGYIHPPAIQVTVAGIGSGNTLDGPNPLSVCMPVNWDKWSSQSGTAVTTKTAGPKWTFCTATPGFPTWSASANYLSSGSSASESTKNLLLDTVATKTSFTIVNNPQPGDFGDSIGIYVFAKDNAYKPYAIRAANVVQSSAVADCDPSSPTAQSTSTVYPFSVKPGVASMTFDSWSATFPTVDWTQTSIASISTLDSSTGVTWSTTDGPECKLLELWASKTACHGISGPWAMASSTAPTAQAGGQFVMYHWLADKKPLDATKVFQIEAGFTVNLLINEHVAPFATDANLAIAKSGWTNGGSDASGYNLLC